MPPVAPGLELPPLEPGTDPEVPEDPGSPGPVLATAALCGLPETWVTVLAAPPVPLTHWVGPCLSQAGGWGAVSASRLAPLGVNVGLLQPWMLMFWVTAPGILVIWSKLASTRLMGMGE